MAPAGGSHQNSAATFSQGCRLKLLNHRIAEPHDVLFSQSNREGNRAKPVIAKGI
jgi:hypothetical protein